MKSRKVWIFTYLWGFTALSFLAFILLVSKTHSPIRYPNQQQQGNITSNSCLIAAFYHKNRLVFAEKSLYSIESSGFVQKGTKMTYTHTIQYHKVKLQHCIPIYYTIRTLLLYILIQSKLDIRILDIRINLDIAIF